MSRHALLVLILLAPATPLAAQNYPLDKCDRDAVPVGYLRARGVVRYGLATNGTPDTTQLQVVSVDTGSVAGFASAARRQLAVCKMKKPAADLEVVQAVRFDSAEMTIAPASPATGQESTLTFPASTPPAPGTPIEERPRWISCDRQPHTKPAGGEFHPSSAATQGAFASSSPMNTGTVNANIVVGADGRVMRDSLTLVESTNPANTSNLIRSLASCRFTPARIAGTPVGTKFLAGIAIVGESYTVVVGRLISIMQFSR